MMTERIHADHTTCSRRPPPNHQDTLLPTDRATGVAAMELTVPYYDLKDAGMIVDIASPKGGVVPVDQSSLAFIIRGEADNRYLADPDLQACRWVAGWPGGRMAGMISL